MDNPRSNESEAWLLAIDSSSEQAGLALFDGVKVLEQSWPAGRNQTVGLLAEIDHLLTLAGITVKDLTCLAVATGPGTFNGLRVAMGLAKGLVLALDLPILGIPTLDAAALPFRATGRSTVAVLAAGRTRVVWSIYQPADKGEAWSEQTPPQNGTITDLCHRLSALTVPYLLTGELSIDQEVQVANLTKIHLLPRALRTRRPAAFAQLAWDRYQRGESDDPVTLEPVYLHATSQQGSVE
ncbi:MAG: tRNA (adenosine(37)-N6)-threonylcarbamoyltransferase complex dimerization subunit type 1 TsaB [Chloroflexota bacterium]|nr:tRNA (adenosine(37)-N6)-threonylcarbamoyltransferase complex dimerization subunit type 1 TsaB [Chloroflexota bacterium]